MKTKLVGALPFWVSLLALGAGAWLRLASLDSLSTMLNWDEAWNGVDALSLLAAPRFTPFFLTNLGRESGWMYWLAPFVAALGAKPFALHLAAAFTSIICLAAAYRLARELFGPAHASWALAALAVLYWPVHLAQRALRVNLYLLVGAVAAALLLRAYRYNRAGAWLAAGAALGLLGYTYYASATWILFLGSLLLALSVLDRRRRLGAILALACAAGLLLPMAAFVSAHSAVFLGRPSDVSLTTVSGLAGSLGRWAGAWFQQGDLNAEFNLPGRPILDPLTGVLAFAGLASFAVRSRWRSGALLLGWAMAAWLPSLLTDAAPHFTRAAGLIIATALVLGVGAGTLSGLLARRLSRPAAAALVMLLFGAVGARTFLDFHFNWLQRGENFIAYEQHIHQAADYVRARAPTGWPVYFSPFSAAHPVVIFRGADLAPRPVAGFASGECLVVSDQPAVYASLTPYEPDFRDRLARWAEVDVLYQDTAAIGSAAPRYSIFATRPVPERLDPAASVAGRFGDALAVRGLETLPATVSPGDALTVVLGTRPLRPLDFAPSLFVHLYGRPTPYEGGPLWAQADQQLCTSYPAHLWRLDETIIQSYTLSLPADLPPGRYTIAVGAYPYPDRPRLPLTPTPDTGNDYLSLHELTVVASAGGGAR